MCKVDGCDTACNQIGSAKGLCKKHYMKKWRRDNPKKQSIIARRAKIKHYFGISLEEYEEMFISQKGRCAICQGKQKHGSRLLAIDHCHLTGVVRGLLCHKCNIGLGLFDDDGALLARAIEYLG
ncbi:hypothetical protein LCGC14_0582180 [marine sediment metagenome]|uniref:Recombination endonuclease VII n=1 Tax=marine sediment metagenome TaxID=412755 RepID=A0A0F9UPA5_9ZZZZ